MGGWDGDGDGKGDRVPASCSQLPGFELEGGNFNPGAVRRAIWPIPRTLYLPPTGVPHATRRTGHRPVVSTYTVVPQLPEHRAAQSRWASPSIQVLYVFGQALSS